MFKVNFLRFLIISWSRSSSNKNSISQKILGIFEWFLLCLIPWYVLCSTMLITPFRRLGTLSYAASHIHKSIFGHSVKAWSHCNSWNFTRRYLVMVAYRRWKQLHQSHSAWPIVAATAGQLNQPRTVWWQDHRPEFQSVSAEAPSEWMSSNALLLLLGSSNPEMTT